MCVNAGTLQARILMLPSVWHAAFLSRSDALQISDLPSREVVPGDVVEMHVGDRVPADTRIIALRTATLRAEQSSLTGESVAVLKSVEAVQEEGCELQAKVRPLDSLPISGDPEHVQSCCSIPSTVLLREIILE